MYDNPSLRNSCAKIMSLAPIGAFGSGLRGGDLCATPTDLNLFNFMKFPRNVEKIVLPRLLQEILDLSLILLYMSQFR